MAGLLIVIVLGETVYFGAQGRKPAPGENVPTADEMRGHLVYGMFYANPDDPRGWVPKPIGYGYTINLRYKSWAAVYGLSILGFLALTAFTVGSAHGK